MRRARVDESAAIDREHLTRALLAQMERAHGTEGPAGLCCYALALGLTSEPKLEDESDRAGSRPEGSA